MGTEGHLTQLLGVTSSHLPQKEKSSKSLLSPGNRDVINTGWETGGGKAAPRPRWKLFTAEHTHGLAQASAAGDAAWEVAQA